MLQTDAGCGPFPHSGRDFKPEKRFPRDKEIHRGRPCPQPRARRRGWRAGRWAERLGRVPGARSHTGHCSQTSGARPRAWTLYSSCPDSDVLPDPPHGSAQCSVFKPHIRLPLPSRACFSLPDPTETPSFFAPQISPHFSYSGAPERLHPVSPMHCKC